MEDAERVRDFYAEVVGWEYSGLDMAGYVDFSMIAPDSGDTVSGICHARGPNASMPPQWLLYVDVEDAEASA